MRLSTRGRYASRAMLDLAMHFGQGPVLLKDIAKRQEVSEKYLERIISALKTASLVKSSRGSRGGYYLLRNPKSITLKNIIFAVEGSVSPVACLDDSKICLRKPECATYEIWLKIKEAITNVLDETTLADLVKIHQQKNKTLMYNI